MEKIKNQLVIKDFSDVFEENLSAEENKLISFVSLLKKNVVEKGCTGFEYCRVDVSYMYNSFYMLVRIYLNAPLFTDLDVKKVALSLHSKGIYFGCFKIDKIENFIEFGISPELWEKL